MAIVGADAMGKANDEEICCVLEVARAVFIEKSSAYYGCNVRGYAVSSYPGGRHQCVCHARSVTVPSIKSYIEP